MKRRTLLFSMLAAVWIVVSAPNARRDDEIFRLRGAMAPATAVDIPAVIRSLRPEYPYSVVPGGVFSRQELRSRIESDATVRVHYADFDVEHVRLVKLTEDRLAYVSYRIGDKIFWTRRMLRIPKGEVLLTDGTRSARTRCGNRLSETPGQNTFTPEPYNVASELPMFDQKCCIAGFELPGTPFRTGIDSAPNPSLDVPGGGALNLPLPRPPAYSDRLLLFPGLLVFGTAGLPPEFTTKRPSGRPTGRPTETPPIRVITEAVPEPPHMYVLGFLLVCATIALRRGTRSKRGEA